MASILKLDSTSPMLTYSPIDKWLFSSTDAKTAVPTAKFSASLFGTYFDVHGNNGDCSSTLSVDGKLANASSGPPPATGIVLQATGLPPAQHTVEVNVVCPPTTQQGFGFNNINVDGWISPSGGIVTDGVSWPVTEDNDPRIFYTGTWTRKLSQSGSNNFELSTQTGDTASISFQNSAIRIYGYVLTPNQGQYTIQLSDGPNVNLQTFNFTAPSEMATIIFFQGGLDPAKLHNLTMTNVGGQVSIDWVDVPLLASASLTLQPSFVSVTSPFSSPTSTASKALGTSAPVPTLSASSKKSINVGPLVGEVIAAIVVVVLLGLLGCWLRRKLRGRKQDPESRGRASLPTQARSPASAQDVPVLRSDIARDETTPLAMFDPPEDSSFVRVPVREK
jgi:hypothetical protein